jgi:hypothetical protein
LMTTGAARNAPVRETAANKANEVMYGFIGSVIGRMNCGEFGDFFKNLTLVILRLSKP